VKRETIELAWRWLMLAFCFLTLAVVLRNAILIDSNRTEIAAHRVRSEDARRVIDAVDRDVKALQRATTQPVKP
jgi:hypothetical protein